MMSGESELRRLQVRTVEDLCEVLRSSRETLSLTQAELAERAGMTRNHYQLLESGRSATGDVANPRLSTLCALAMALDLPIEKLVRGDPSR